MPQSHWTSHPVTYKHWSPEGANAQWCMDRRSEPWKAALENDCDPLPPETSGGKNVTPGNSCELQHAQELPQAPSGQVSCCLGESQGLYFYIQLLLYDLVGKKLWRFLYPTLTYLELPWKGDQSRVLRLMAKEQGSRCSRQTHILERVVWGMAGDTVSLSKARLCNPVSQLSWEPHKAVPFRHSLRKTASPFLMIAGGQASVEEGKNCLPTSFPNQRLG